MQTRKLPRRHLQCRVNARRIVRMNGLVDGSGQFPERSETVRVPKIHFELVVEGLLIPILPRTPWVRSRYGNAKLCEKLQLDRKYVVEKHSS